MVGCLEVGEGEGEGEGEAVSDMRVTWRRGAEWLVSSKRATHFVNI